MLCVLWRDERDEGVHTQDRENGCDKRTKTSEYLVGRRFVLVTFHTCMTHKSQSFGSYQL